MLPCSGQDDVGGSWGVHGCVGVVAEDLLSCVMRILSGESFWQGRSRWNCKGVEEKVGE